MAPRVVCIDPGKRIGYAVITEGRITSCGTVGEPEALPTADACVYEMPRVYADPAKWKGDPQHVVMVALCAGRCAARYPLAHEVEPRQWRGNAPERVVRARTSARLLEGEPGDVGTRSAHAWDALGIAVWLLKRPLPTCKT